MPADLTRGFHLEMLEVYRRAAAECGYRPQRFLAMVEERGGLEAARSLLAKSQPSEGLAILWEHQRLDLSMEATVCRQPWHKLFTESEIAVARKRLDDLGYLPEEPE
jgi:hypothetical protein